MFSSWMRTLRDYFKGVFLYGLYSHLYTERRGLDDLLALSVFGRLVGFPFLFNYYHLRLLPYYLPRLQAWRRSVLRERDFFDQIND
ncbi:MAG: hypothetical protein ACLFUP_07535 [Desulfobacteraceae bacterium]